MSDKLMLNKTEVNITSGGSLTIKTSLGFCFVVNCEAITGIGCGTVKNTVDIYADCKFLLTIKCVDKKETSQLIDLLYKVLLPLQAASPVKTLAEGEHNE